MQITEMKSLSPSPPPRRLAPDCLLEELIGELTKGRGSANELLTSKSLTEEQMQVLARKIDSSFSNCLSMLDSSGDGDDLQSSKNSIAVRSCESEDSGQRSKNQTAKDRRGSYRRRKACQARIVDSPNEVADEYAWRKYGKKTILNAKYPRNYYRCSYKIDQACMATKHVHQIADNPPVFRIIYNGQHTCKTPLKLCHHNKLDSLDESEPSNILGFESNHSIGQSLNPSISSILDIAQEGGWFTREETIMARNQSPPSQHLPQPHPTALRSSSPTTGASSLDYGDVIRGWFNIDDYLMDAGSSVVFDEIGPFNFNIDQYRLNTLETPQILSSMDFIHDNHNG